MLETREKREFPLKLMVYRRNISSYIIQNQNHLNNYISLCIKIGQLRSFYGIGQEVPTRDVSPPIEIGPKLKAFPHTNVYSRDTLRCAAMSLEICNSHFQVLLYFKRRLSAEGAKLANNG